MKSYLSHLECTTCGKTHKEVDRNAVSHRSADMWRYFEMLPVLDEANVVSLGEGLTPILDAPRLGEAMGASNLVVKDEGQHQTGTFKSRGISAAVSKAKELGAGAARLSGLGLRIGLGPTGAAT